MKQANKIQSNVRKIERRKHWCDRRVDTERRSSGRSRQMETDCRSYVPRREEDIAGSVVEGEIWWSGDRRFV